MRMLREEPDTLPIHGQVQEQARTAIRDHGCRNSDLRISFSHEGLSKARAATVPGFDPWGPRHSPTHYVGLPFVTDPKQKVDVLVQLLDGSPTNERS